MQMKNSLMQMTVVILLTIKVNTKISSEHVIPEKLFYWYFRDFGACLEVLTDLYLMGLEGWTKMVTEMVTTPR